MFGVPCADLTVDLRFALVTRAHILVGTNTLKVDGTICKKFVVMATSKASGILFLTIQPTADFSPADFHEWYENYIGPFRQADLASFVANASLYHAIDVERGGGVDARPEWAAIYEVTDVSEPAVQEYLKSKDASSGNQSEQDIRQHMKVDARSFELIESWETEEFRKTEDIDAKDEATIIVALHVVLKPERKGEELERWYSEEHIPMISKVPGWRCTQLFKATSSDCEKKNEYLTLHEYSLENGLKGREFKAAVETPRAKDMQLNAPEELTRRLYRLYSLIRR